MLTWCHAFNLHRLGFSDLLSQNRLGQQTPDAILGILYLSTAHQQVRRLRMSFFFHSLAVRVVSIYFVTD